MRAFGPAAPGLRLWARYPSLGCRSRRMPRRRVRPRSRRVPRRRWCPRPRQRRTWCPRRPGRRRRVLPRRVPRQRCCLVDWSRIGRCFALELRLQGREQACGLRERSVEQRGRVREARLHAARELGEEDLARLEVGQLLDLTGLEDLPVEEPPLDDERRVVLREVTQTLGRLDDVAGDEGDGGRTDEQLLVELDAGLLGGDLRQRVLRDEVARAPAERAAQFLQLLDGETAVVGEDGAGRATEALRELRDGCFLVRACHVSPSSRCGTGVRMADP